jgi:Xaa-Pro aminopeptidase
MYRNLFEQKIDAYLIVSPINRFYFTDFSSSYGYLLLTENAKTFYTDPRYFEEAKSQIGGFTVKSVTSEEVFSSIAAELKKAGVTTLGYEDDFWTVAAFKTFKKDFEAFTLKPASEIIRSLRLLKTERELSRIEAAQRIAERAFDKVTDMIRPGMTEREVRTMLISEGLRMGADDVAFDPIVAFGEHSAVPHHSAGAREFKKGDLILIDYGVKVGGYCSDMTRTFYLSDPGEGSEGAQRLSAIYDIVLGAQDYALKHMKAGMTCREADSLAREYIRANGYDQEFGHSLGHGLGLEIHEPPRVRENSKEMLMPGMVVTVEPGIYVQGLGGIRIEDMVVIKEDGVQNLTETPKKLII